MAALGGGQHPDFLANSSENRGGKNSHADADQRRGEFMRDSGRKRKRTTITTTSAVSVVLH